MQQTNLATLSISVKQSKSQTKPQPRIVV